MTFAGEDAFRFRHVLIRNAAYDGLPKQVRAELHERFADWLVAAAGVRHDRGGGGARLPLRAGVPPPHGDPGHRRDGNVARRPRRAACSRRPGVGRSTRGDAPAAVNLLERAGALLPEDAPERLELRLELADALHECRRVAASRRAAGGCADAAEAAGDAGVEARARLELACLRPSSIPSRRRSTTSFTPPSSCRGLRGDRRRCGAGACRCAASQNVLASLSRRAGRAAAPAGARACAPCR